MHTIILSSFCELKTFFFCVYVFLIQKQSWCLINNKEARLGLNQEHDTTIFTKSHKPYTKHSEACCSWIPLFYIKHCLSGAWCSDLIEGWIQKPWWFKRDEHNRYDIKRCVSVKVWGWIQLRVLHAFNKKNNNARGLDSDDPNKWKPNTWRTVVWKLTRSARVFFFLPSPLGLFHSRSNFTFHHPFPSYNQNAHIHIQPSLSKPFIKKKYSFLTGLKSKMDISQTLNILRSIKSTTDSLIWSMFPQVQKTEWLTCSIWNKSVQEVCVAPGRDKYHSESHLWKTFNNMAHFPEHESSSSSWQIIRKFYSTDYASWYL